jgi:hypothetical protein
MSETRKLAAILVADVVGIADSPGRDEDRRLCSRGTTSDARAGAACPCNWFPR